MNFEFFIPNTPNNHYAIFCTSNADIQAAELKHLTLLSKMTRTDFNLVFGGKNDGEQHYLKTFFLYKLLD